ncbi:hypothetical protein KOR42_55510 [Thalassoglobus neptunius]|uniref:Planctomycete cytochrome C n=1 Tax=Thalassoglobus neptunius TaxID=1938619 RepID=A0A5C5UUB5_9PLAN|nr:hypothetical protein KOR42_55510 [Thalassoglobus neptunius]
MSMTQLIIPVQLAVILLVVSVTRVSASEEVGRLFKGHCFDCHDDVSQEGNFQIDQLSTKSVTHDSAKTWSKILRKLEAGTMPPPMQERPPTKDVASVIEWTKRALADESSNRHGKGGSLTRRLNRLEYENTVHDLLGVDVPLKNLLPEDDFQDGFNTSAEALRVSPNAVNRMKSVLGV